MELVTGDDGNAAPRLNDVQLSAETAREYHAFLISQVVRMLCAGIVHGDLSEFNILVGSDGPVIIDLPQAVDAASNNHAKDMLMRDVNNLATYFGQFAPELKNTQYGKEIWALYERGELSVETKLTGRFAQKEKAVDMRSVMREIENAKFQEAARLARLEEGKKMCIRDRDSTGFKVTTTINQVTTESIQFLESGVILRVTPSVDQQGRVLLKVHPEVSSASLNAGIPSKKSTEVTTELLSEDGQAVFIGGLIKKISRKDKAGVPILGDIPGIGRLFSTTTESVNNTETVIIITPRIIQDPKAASEFTEEKLGQIDHASDLIADHQQKLESSQIKDKLDTAAPL